MIGHQTGAAESFFADFRAGIAAEDPLPGLRAGLIGQDIQVPGPFGPRPMIYADYVASGRALIQVERAILEGVLPYYANSHTEASYCGAQVTHLRRAARGEIARICGAGPEHAVIFAGSGATAGLNRLVHLLGVAAAGPGAVVLHGPYEHHSNILPWRESGAQVVQIPEAATGGPDLQALDAALAEVPPGALVVGSFSAASNVTGILTDVVAVTRRLKAAGALAVWDYAGGGPYLPIAMTPAPGVEIDAIITAPHKFVGGPQASGVMILRRDAVRAQVPTFPGGGTVRFVWDGGHDYLTDVVDREEAGTPNVVGDIRAALAFVVKDVVGATRIGEIDDRLAHRMMARLRAVPRFKVLGNLAAPRLPIFSLTIAPGANGAIPPQFATRLLSDRFGIQARGGCACAGPYGHRLLDIDPATSARLRERILAGDVVEKPGFLRFNLGYLMTETEVEAIAGAMERLPDQADQDLPRYGFEPATGLYQLRAA